MLAALLLQLWASGTDTPPSSVWTEETLTTLVWEESGEDV